MTESRLVDGTPMFVVRTEHFVRRGNFATALTDFFYGKNEDFPKTLSKKEAQKILKNQLFFFGLQGEHEDGYFEAAYELGEIYNTIFSDAANWVDKNYPYLKEAIQ